MTPLAFDNTRLPKRVDAPPEAWTTMEQGYIRELFAAAEIGDLVIHSITHVGNADSLKAFEDTVRTLPEGDDWVAENEPNLRHRVMQRFEAIARRTQGAVAIIPMWQGTSKASVDENVTGRQRFMVKGEESFVNIYGEGTYFTPSLDEACRHARDTVLFSWVAVRTPFPVVNDGRTPCASDLNRIARSAGVIPGYDAHYIPLNDQEMPCTGTEIPLGDRFVIFDGTQVYTQFAIELGMPSPSGAGDISMVEIADRLNESGPDLDTTIFDFVTDEESWKEWAKGWLSWLKNLITRH